MNPFSNSFEKKWFFIMIFLYVFIMLPFPWYYNEKYVAGPFGVPVFIYGWIIHALVVLAAIIIWRSQCMKRPEYQDKILEEGDK